MAWRTGRVRWDGREGSQPGVFGGDGGGHQWVMGGLSSSEHIPINSP